MSNYDLIVLGGGAAGLTAAGAGAQLGAKTLLIERHTLGGECLNTGCVPSKALIRSANVAALIGRAREFGIETGPTAVNFAEVMERVARVIRRIEPRDSPQRLARYGVETRFGQARFVSPREIEVNGEKLRARRFIVATGSQPLIPPIDGLSHYLTNETIFEIRRRPDHLMILGAGPVGVEMAQAFVRLGSRVTLLDMAPHILPREDPEVSEQVKAILQKDGVQVYVDATARRDSVTLGADGIVEHALEFDHQGSAAIASGDALLVAVGRRPNVEGLGLENAKVEVSQQGIQIDARCRTTARNIYACGDVTGQYQFTHVAEHQAKIAMANAILRLPMKLDYRAVPWVIFTEPEMARVGMTEAEARRKHGEVKVYRVQFRNEDRAITDSETTGILKVIATRSGKKILGAHIVGPHAGELIMEFTLAIRHGLSPAKLSATIHPYPTLSLAGRHAADFYWTEKSTANLARWVRRIFGYSGPIAERYRGEDDDAGAV